MEDSERNRNQRTIISVLCILTVIFLIVGVWFFFYNQAHKPLMPDYAPKELESNAQSMEDDDSQKLTNPEGGGAVSITYSKNISVDMSEQEVSLLIGNPSKSNQDIVFQVVAGDTVLAQSGRLMPGNAVKRLQLVRGLSEKLGEGGYDGKIIINYYNQLSGEKAILNTEIPVTITVEE